MLSALGDLRVFLFSVVTLAFCIYDIEWGHQLDKQTALTLLLAVLAGVGIGVAHTAGVNAASSTQTPPTPP